VVPKVEPNTNDSQSRSLWGQPSSAPPQQHISHPPPHCKIFICFYYFVLWVLGIVLMSDLIYVALVLSMYVNFCNN
jgi:hypothetical protein